MPSNPSSSPGSGESTTLSLLILSGPTSEGFGEFLDMRPLAWKNAPKTATWAEEMDFLDLGDAECKPVPSFPQKHEGGGLWILRWSYQMDCESRLSMSYEADDEPAEVSTAFYADTCEWSRPTLADLIAFGLLPAEPTNV